MFNFKICDVTYWAKNNYNKGITQYLKKPKLKPFQAMKFDHWVKNSLRNIFCKNYAQNYVDKLVPDLLCFLKKSFI